MVANALVDHQSEFSVSYEGPSFEEHTMDVRDLAPALLALGQTFDRANSLLNGDRASISLKIRANRPGSFEVALFLDQVLKGASDVFSGALFTSADNLTEIVVGGPAIGVGLIALLKRLRGKKPRIGDHQPDGVVLEAENLRLFVPTEVARLYSDNPVRDHLEAFVRPLFKVGVDRVVFKQAEEEIESVQCEEAEYFNSDPEDAVVTENIIPRQRLQISSLNFNKQGKWRLHDGANMHWYSMKDEEFVKEIQQGKRFGVDDILVCEVLMTQRLDDMNKLKLEYSVQHVLQHIVPGEQIRLPNVGFTVC